jgi:hypothetical protein
MVVTWDSCMNGPIIVEPTNRKTMGVHGGSEIVHPRHMIAQRATNNEVPCQ